jgi:anti-anti-sigma factor
MVHSLDIEVLTEGDACVVVVGGEVDMATAPQLDAALAAVDGNVVVDLAAVSFLDSSGIGVIVRAAQRAQAGGYTLRTRAERDNVWRTLKVTNLAELLHPDRD